jgi:TLC domain
VGVDFTSCAVVAYLGLKNAQLCRAMWFSPSTLHPSGSESRMFTYHAAGHQILLFFLSYQIKNLFDSIIWNDGPEYIFHHIAAGSAAFFGMYPGYAHFYAIFFMGISEVSTAVLVLLANFDEKLGIDGFSEAFPSVKIGLGIFFVVLFILCRVIMWPIATYFFLKDAQTVLKLSTPQVNARRSCIKATMISLTGLSILQAVWLIQIYAISKVEVAKIINGNN